MEERYARAEHRNVSGLMSDVLKSVGDKPAFIELHNLVEMLDVNLIDKYFKQAFAHDPFNGLATLIQYDVIHLYDFSKFLDNTDCKTENCSEISNNCANCKHLKKHNGNLADWVCDRKGSIVTNPYDKECDEMWERKDEPQTTSTPYKVDTSSICKIEPQTDCAWK